MGLGEWWKNANAATGRGFSRLGEGLFAPDPSMGVDPAAVQRARQNAIMQLGLGLMAGKGGLASFSGAQETFGGAMQNAFQNAERKRLEKKGDDRYEADRKYTLERDKVEDTRAEAAARARAEQLAAERDLAERRLRIEGSRATRDANLSNAELQASAGAAERMRIENTRLQELMGKGWANLTESEKEEFEVLRTGRRPRATTDFMGLGSFGGMGTPPFAPQQNPIALDDSLFAP